MSFYSLGRLLTVRNSYLLGRLYIYLLNLIKHLNCLYSFGALRRTLHGWNLPSLRISIDIVGVSKTARAAQTISPAILMDR